MLIAYALSLRQRVSSVYGGMKRTTRCCVTVDFDTLGGKGPEMKDAVTLCHDDDDSQERVQISKLLGRLLSVIL